MINTKIARPIDPYSPLWGAYWAQNPHLRRGVGADAVDPPAGDPPADPPAPATIDPAEFKRLQDENALFKKKHEEAEKHRKEQEKLAGDNARKAAAAAGDIKALEESWTTKYTARETELGQEVATYRGMVEELTAGSTASEICNKIAMEGCALALMPHVRGRLKSEIVDGKPVTRVLDAQGNISAMTPDDLIKELKAVPYLAPLIIGSKASGAGNPGGQGNGGNSKEMTRSEFDKLDAFKKREFSLKGGRVVD